LLHDSSDDSDKGDNSKLNKNTPTLFKREGVFNFKLVDYLAIDKKYQNDIIGRVILKVGDLFSFFIGVADEKNKKKNG